MVTRVTPPTNARGRVRLGFRISPAILLASHQPPKLKNALITPPAIAGNSASDPGRRTVKGTRLAIWAWPETTAQPTSANRIKSLKPLTNDMTAALKRVPMRLMAPNRQSSKAGATASPVCPGVPWEVPAGSSWATYGAEPTASAAATPGYMTMELIQP